nr:MAG TPA: hypothetical protein [Caudoviricetes sp.]DAI55492.1 MAG TPA: hypothetical protein [Caudoviricetes sp.]DAW65637.1 MAG TPA: hypothetical protein [Caudoviricetes sp.]
MNNEPSRANWNYGCGLSYLIWHSYLMPPIILSPC